MIAPRNIYDLADTVEAEQLAQEGANLEQVTSRSPWVAAYLRTKRMDDSTDAGKKRKELFLYVVICSALLRIPQTESEKSQRLIEMARQRFFLDSEFWQCTVSFTDIHNNLDEIFRLYYVEENGSQMLRMLTNVETTSLRQKLISLRQDQVVRDSLEPVYSVFLNAKNEHPGKILQQCKQCILSLL